MDKGQRDRPPAVDEAEVHRRLPQGVAVAPPARRAAGRAVVVVGARQGVARGGGRGAVALFGLPRRRPSGGGEAKAAWGGGGAGGAQVGYPQDIEGGALGELERVGKVQALYPFPLDIDWPVVATGGRVWKALDLVGWVRAVGRCGLVLGPTWRTWTLRLMSILPCLSVGVQSFELFSCCDRSSCCFLRRLSALLLIFDLPGIESRKSKSGLSHSEKCPTLFPFLRNFKVLN